MVKSMAGNVARQLGSLVADTAKEAIKQPLGLDKLTGSPPPPPSSPNLSRMIEKDQAESEAELKDLRTELAQSDKSASSGPARNVEGEIKQVRIQKKSLLEKKEQELLEEVRRKREEEELLAQEESLPSKPKPTRGSAFARGGPKSKEVDLRRSV